MALAILAKNAENLMHNINELHDKITQINIKVRMQKKEEQYDEDRCKKRRTSNIRSNKFIVEQEGNFSSVYSYLTIKKAVLKKN